MNPIVMLTSLLVSVCRGCTCGHIPDSPVEEVEQWMLKYCEPEELIAIELVALGLADGFKWGGRETLFNYGRETFKGAPLFRKGHCFALEHVVKAISIVKNHGFPVQWVREMQEKNRQKEQ